MSHIISGTRYLVIIPIVGLGMAAAVIFILGGIGLISLIINGLAGALGFTHEANEVDIKLVVYHLVEYVHTFLVGTVIYITALGLYQLFIKEIPVPHWLEIHNTEQLETNLISVTVVVLAVNLMGIVLVGSTENLLDLGAGIALPIAALALFVGLRAWAGSISHKSPVSRASTTSSSGNQPAIEEAAKGQN